MVAQRELSRDVPVGAGHAGVDDRHLAGFLQQVRIDDAPITDPIDARCDLHKEPIPLSRVQHRLGGEHAVATVSGDRHGGDAGQGAGEAGELERPEVVLTGQDGKVVRDVLEVEVVLALGEGDVRRNARVLPVEPYLPGGAPTRTGTTTPAADRGTRSGRLGCPR